jgi:hypothetical protein
MNTQLSRFSAAYGCEATGCLPLAAHPLCRLAQFRANGSHLPNDLGQHPLLPPAIETRVPAIRTAPKDLLSRAKVEPPVGDHHNHLAAHHLTFQVGIAVVLAGVVVAVASDRLVGGLA